jgi:hypothetical protein
MRDFPPTMSFKNDPPLENNDFVRLGHKPRASIPRYPGNSFFEARQLPVLVSSDESYLFPFKPAVIGQFINGLLPPFGSSAIRGDDFHKDQKRIIRSQVNEDNIGQILGKVIDKSKSKRNGK